MAKRCTLSEFIEKAHKVHKGENLEYTNAVYVNNSTPLCIIDHDINPETGQEYGEYWQTPNKHLSGHGHPLKGINKQKSRMVISQDEFIRRSKDCHPGENLEYSKVEYKNMYTPVCIIDHDINPKTGKEYGEYWQAPVNHLKGCGHPLKGIVNSQISKVKNYKPNSTKKLTLDAFVMRSEECHPGEKLDYSKTNYVNSTTKVCIIDHDINPKTGKEYGEYWQTPKAHLMGHGHPEKARIKRIKGNMLSLNEFIKRDKIVHVGENIEYGEYHGMNKRMLFIDHDINPHTGKEYGEYYCTPNNHLKGDGFPNKRREINAKRKAIKVDDFIDRAKKAHPNESLEYPFLSEELKNNHDKITIHDMDINPNTGKEYGYYKQSPYLHLNGSSIKEKGILKYSKSNTLTTEEFKSKAILLHPEFNYSKSYYKGNRELITITCPIHGDFKTTPDVFFRSIFGCPKCANSGVSQKEEDVCTFIKYLIGNNAVQQSNYSILSNKQLDIYIESMNIAIEFDGLFWHSTGSPNYQGDSAILNKTEECLHKGIRLIHIFEDEWDEHPDLVKDKLSYILGCSKDKRKIGARKCEIREIYKSDSDAFLEKNHIQGRANASVYLGAFYQGKLVSVMLFKKTGKDGEYELNRFASDIQYVIQGVASKLLKHFLNMKLAKSIISFADRRWTDESKNVYISLGFSKVGYTRPTYWYCGKREPLHRYHKFGFRKQILARKFKFSTDMTESEMVKELGLNKIYDCGLIKYELKC